MLHNHVASFEFLEVVTVYWIIGSNSFSAVGSLGTRRHIMGRILFIEPFYGGSHKQLVDLLLREFRGSLFTLPASKWHWRARASALHFAMNIPQSGDYRTLFASSVLNLCELASLRPDLARLHKVLYFHENQLVYPVRKQQERDFHYGYSQILSCLVADTILFNSHFNMTSFLDSIDSYLKLMPDYRPKGLKEQIQPKCKVLYFPMELPLSNITTLQGDVGRDELEKAVDNVKSEGEHSDNNHGGIGGTPQDVSGVQITSHEPESVSSLAECSVPHTDPLHILWPHRWEHDKGPDEFCSVLLKLLEAGIDFRVSILGAHTNDIPSAFQTTIPQLAHRVLHQGHLPRQEYWRVLREADVVLSTARHEFFGVAMLEAVFCGCYPLCPNRLVYPEIYPSECLYNTEQQLFKRLKRFCQNPSLARLTQCHPNKIDLVKFSWETLKPEYHKILTKTDASNGHVECH